MKGTLPAHNVVWFLAIAGCVATAFAAISTQSFWIDEAYAAWKASQPGLLQWWREMVLEQGSDRQMPLYMLYLWLWEKVFGHGEWWMRAGNIPWLLLGLLALARRRAVLLVAAIASPFVWYCLDEARPYAMQLGTSLLILAALSKLSETNEPHSSSEERTWLALCAFGVVLLSGSSLLGMIWAGAAVGVALAAIPWARSWRLIRSHWFVLLAAAPFLTELGVYYLWTLKSSARLFSGASTDVRNILFVAYELLGFSGLGPGRLEIRTEGLAAFRAYLVPLTIFGGFLVAVLWMGARNILKKVPRRTIIGAVFFLAGTALLLLAVGYVKHFRVLGRHFTPLFSVVVWSIAAGLSTLWGRRSRVARAVAAGYVVASLLSCFSLRLAARHAKDDYRGAAAQARAALAQGDTVWWSAALVGGRFYGLAIVPPESGAAQNAAWSVVDCPGEVLNRLPVPQLVVFSKPDLHDSKGTLTAYLSRSGFKQVGQLPAFTLWRKGPG